MITSHSDNHNENSAAEANKGSEVQTQNHDNVLSRVQNKTVRQFNRLLSGFAFTLAVLFIAVIFYLSHLQEKLLNKAATETADTIAQVVLQVRAQYAETVVARIVPHGGIARHDYQQYPSAIPLPATFTFELGKRLKKSLQTNVGVDLYSPFPFPWREKDSKSDDNFKSLAWTSLNHDPFTPYVRIEKEGAKRYLRLGIADTMKQSCVNCHNSHPNSPKTDWNIGDIRGILEVKYPIDVAGSQSILFGLTVLLATGGGLCLVFIFFAIDRQRDLTKKLVLENQSAQRAHSRSERNATQLEQSELAQRKSNNLLESSNVELQQQAKELEAARLSTHKLLQKVAEEKDRAIQAGNAKGMFLATMSHEIRTPMNGILGMAKLLSESDLEDKQKKQLDVITRSGSLLLSIINDILEFSKLDNHAIELEHIPFNMGDLFDDVHRLLLSSAEDNSTILQCQIIENCPKYLLGDPSRLKQILINLTSNAIKFTKSGSVTVVARALSFTENNAALIRIEVADTGIGIGKEEQKNLFEAFTQADASTTRKFGGTGLGLAICLKILAKMDTDIRLESDIGQGSRFWFDIEMQLSNELDAPSLEYTPEKPELAATESTDFIAQLSGHILVVEDDAVNQVVVGAMLEATNITFDVANNGEDAVKQFESGKYALILMDCQMPIMDGYIATNEIRQKEKEGSSRIPIVALTANALSSDKDKCINAGMDDFLTKPLMPEILYRVLNQWL